MKNKIIIVVISVLAICAICLGVLIALMPDPIEQIPVDIHTPNSIIETLGIERKKTELERLYAIRTYQEVNGIDELIEDIISIGQVSSFEYFDLTNGRGSDYLLVTPFEINGKLEISSVKYDEAKEKYVADQTLYKGNNGENIPDNYALLLRYSRPSDPEIEIKLTQEKDGHEQTATYQVVDKERIEKTGQYVPVKTTQYVKDDISAGTESVGIEIKLADTQE